MQTLDQRARDQIQGSGYAMQTTPYAEVELGSSWTLVRQNSQRSTSFHSQVVILVGQLPAFMGCSPLLLRQAAWLADEIHVIFKIHDGNNRLLALCSIISYMQLYQCV